VGLGRGRLVSPGRLCAFRVLRRVFELGAFADRALHGEAAGLERRERAFATALAYGSVQRRATLDYLVSELSSRAPAALDPPVLAALRLGIFQLLFLGGVADHAAVYETVELASAAQRGSGGFVNAVLRRAAREGRALLDALDERDPAAAAILHSLPRWLVDQWWHELGLEESLALMRRCNEPAESALRVNTLLAVPAAVRAAIEAPLRTVPELPEAIVLDGPFDAHGSELFASGMIMPQSRGSMRVARELDPLAGDRVLDLCAAPGAKTTHLAALIGDSGEIVAVERHPGRAAALERTCRRMQAGSVRVEVGDAAAYEAQRPFHRVLVDPPCSGLGTLQSRPDLRWRVRPESVRDLAALQARILSRAGGATSPGGTLVYSVCTISRLECEQVVKQFLAAHPRFSLAHQLQLLPHRDGTDGFFIARLERAG
jgi:16S rRNA (cytosine967-C5)-methyltransferase